MNIETVQSLALVVGVFGVAAFVAFAFAAWLDSRETNIEPIVSEGAQK